MFRCERKEFEVARFGLVRRVGWGGRGSRRKQLREQGRERVEIAGDDAVVVEERHGARPIAFERELMREFRVFEFGHITLLSN